MRYLFPFPLYSVFCSQLTTTHHLQKPVPIFIINDYDEGVADVQCPGSAVCCNPDSLKNNWFQKSVQFTVWDKYFQFKLCTPDKGDAYQMNAITFVLTLQLNSLTR